MKKRKFRYSLSAMIIFGILFLIAVMEIGAAAIGYTVFTDVTTRQYETSAHYTANTIANLIDGDTLEQYLQTGEKDENYRSTESTLQTIVDNSGSVVIYVTQVNPEQKERTTIYAVVNSESGLDQYPLGHVTRVSDEFLENYGEVVEGTAGDSSVSGHSEDLGDYITVMSPMYDSSGKLVAVCNVVKTLDFVVSGRTQFLKQLLIWALFLSILTGSINIILLRKRIVMPLRTISDETVRFTSKKQAETSHLAEQLNMHNEIGDLAEAVDKMERIIIQDMTDIIKVTKERNRIGAELNIAKNIQSNVLPHICETFPGRSEIDLCAIMHPAREVGGDFYDCFFLDQNRFCMVIADVSDKGVPAALFMMNSKVLLKTSAMASGDPAEILARVNRILCENNESGMFITVWLGILDLSTGVIRASNAGHEYPMIREGKNDFRILKDRHGLVLGAFEEAVYTNYEISLSPGDRLFLYTDGLAEASDPEKNQFGLDRMLQSLNSCPELSPEGQVHQIMADVDRFVNDAPQFDDTTILALRYNGPVSDPKNRETTEDFVNPPENPEESAPTSESPSERDYFREELVVPAVLDSITTVTEFVNSRLDEMDGSPHASMQLSIIIDELMGNIINYGYPDVPGSVTVLFRQTSETEVELTLMDHGIPYNPLEREDPDITASAEERSIGGLGIFMAKKFSDELIYRHEDGKNILTVRKTIRE